MQCCAVVMYSNFECDELFGSLFMSITSCPDDVWVGLLVCRDLLTNILLLHNCPKCFLIAHCNLNLSTVYREIFTVKIIHVKMFCVNKFSWFVDPQNFNG